MRIYELVMTRKYVGQFKQEKLAKPEEAGDFLETTGIADKVQEHFIVVCLDTRNNTVMYQVTGVGSVDRCIANPKDIFRAPIICGASKIVIAHNHPSGDLEPSVQDLRTTEQLVEAGKILNIQVIDHFIVGMTEGKYKWKSLRQCGYF